MHSEKTIDGVWTELKQLEGTDVETLCQNSKNHIFKFNDKEMIRYADPPRGRGAATAVPRRTFKIIWENLVKCGEFEPSITPAYRIACACIARLPEVEYSCKENRVHLYILPQRTHEFGTVREH